MENPKPFPRYKWTQRLALRLVPRLAAFVLRAWAASWRVALPIPRDLDPRWTSNRYIYAFWHEGVLTIIPHWRGSQIQGLASQSFDGALIAAAMVHLGYPAPARGSSSRGGAAALRAQMEGLSAGMHVSISVDGPRGPRYVAKPGVVQLAALSGHSIVPVSGAAYPLFRLRNWDQTMLPLPFARVAFVLGAPIKVKQGFEDEALKQLNEALMEGTRFAGMALDSK